MTSLNDTTLLRDKAFIDGRWVAARSGETFDVTNPATGEILGPVPDMGQTETRAAIEAANRAYPACRARTAKDRAAILRRWHDLVHENLKDLAALLTSEQGKPLGEATGEVIYGASFLEGFAEEGKRVYGETIPQHEVDKRILVIKEPVGVCAGVNTSMQVSREETFGPLAPLFRFKTENEAIRLANDTEYGLAAYFYSQDISRVWRVAEALEYGMIGINSGVVSTEIAPFGGMKESGIGNEGSHYGIDEFLEIKYLSIGGIE